MTDDELTATLTASPCALAFDWPWPAGRPCGEDSFATAVFACAHEHVTRIRVCWGCASDLQQGAGTFGCRDCEECSSPHECPTLLVIEWDSGEKTIIQEAPHD